MIFGGFQVFCATDGMTEKQVFVAESIFLNTTWRKTQDTTKHIRAGEYPMGMGGVGTGAYFILFHVGTRVHIASFFILFQFSGANTRSVHDKQSLWYRRKGVPA